MRAIWEKDQVTVDGAVVATVARSIWTEKADVTINGVRWEFGKDGSDRIGTVVGEPAARCRAARPSFWRADWEIAVGPTTRYLLAPEGVFRRGYALSRDGRRIGSSGNDGFWGLKPTLEAPDDMPVPDTVFALWIAFLMRARANQAAASSG